MNEFTVEGWVIIIGAIGIVINNAISNWKMSAKVDTVVQTTKVIEGHVNSAASKAVAEREALVAERISLRATIDEMRKTAALLAQALAIKDASQLIPISAIPAISQTNHVIPNSGSKAKDSIEEVAENLEIKAKDIKDTKR